MGVPTSRDLVGSSTYALQFTLICREAYSYPYSGRVSIGVALLHFSDQIGIRHKRTPSPPSLTHTQLPTSLKDFFFSLWSSPTLYSARRGVPTHLLTIFNPSTIILRHANACSDASKPGDNIHGGVNPLCPHKCEARASSFENRMKSTDEFGREVDQPRVSQLHVTQANPHRHREAPTG
ncbi:hypothetical protein BJV78DRAFT_722499 [Lactifluus subvellereus]|nr:hypothetical protein BJV78DRAFT_722499 [Lactifluus subvellereus]